MAAPKIMDAAVFAGNVTGPGNADYMRYVETLLPNDDYGDTNIKCCRCLTFAGNGGGGSCKCGRTFIQAKQGNFEHLNSPDLIKKYGDTVAYSPASKTSASGTPSSAVATSLSTSYNWKADPKLSTQLSAIEAYISIDAMDKFGDIMNLVNFRVQGWYVEKVHDTWMDKRGLSADDINKYIVQGHKICMDLARKGSKGPICEDLMLAHLTTS